MRLLLELVIAAALIALAWQKSFKEWTSEVPGIGPRLTAPAQAPQRKTTAPPATVAASAKTFTGHIYYTDEQGKSYWLDAQGKHHYQPQARMRLLVDLIIAAAIIALGWEKPLKERVSELPWLGDKTATTESHPRSSTLNPRPVPTASLSGAWMWDPNRKTVLDRISPTPHRNP